MAHSSRSRGGIGARGAGRRHFVGRDLLGRRCRGADREAPEAARKVRQQVSETRRDGATSFQQIQDAATELQGAATADGRDGRQEDTQIDDAGEPPRRDNLAADYALAQSALLANVVAQAPIVLLLVYFLLAAGEHFRRKLVQSVGPTLTAKKDAIRILDEIDSQIQRYLLATVACNVLIALGTWLAFWAMGVEHAGAWGVGAGVLHFIPYLGPGLFAIVSGAGGFMQFGTAMGALAVAGTSLLVATAIGSLVMTWVQSRVAASTPRCSSSHCSSSAGCGVCGACCSERHCSPSAR
jgi:predicted PurR-regulated permease PerM